MAQGHRDPNWPSGLALPIHTRASSGVAFFLLHVASCRALGLVMSSHRAESEKGIEIMVPRRRVRVLERQPHARDRYRRADGAILAATSRLLPRTRRRSFPVTPDTLLRWHRKAVKHKWRRWRRQRDPGSHSSPPAVPSTSPTKWWTRSTTHRVEVLPRRWVVERTWPWLMGNRRPQVDYGRNPIVTEGSVRAAYSRLFLRRLTDPAIAWSRPGSTPRQPLSPASPPRTRSDEPRPRWHHLSVRIGGRARGGR